MWTASILSENAYSPFLKEAAPDRISRETYGDALVYPDKRIFVTKGGFRVADATGEETLESWTVQQTDDGIDREDRIEFLKRRLPLPNMADVP